MPKIWKTDEEIIGHKVPIKGTDRFYEVLPWDGGRTEKFNTKLFPICCEVCSNDKELFPDKILIRKGDIKKGYCPCGCAKVHSYNKEAINVICRRLAENLNHIEILDVYNTDGKIYNTTMDTYCSIHNYISEKVRYTNIKGNNGHFCNECGKDSLVNSKIKTIEHFKSTFDIPSTSYVVYSGEVNSIGHRYWYYICEKCSNDKYVKAGVCNGVFKTTTGELQRGKIPCRCKTYYSIPYNIAKFNIDAVCNEKSYTFIEWIDGYENGKSNFRYTCSLGHKNITNYHKFVTSDYGCKSCNVYGFYEGRYNEQDTLYIIKLEDSFESFYKIGRSFNVRDRYREYSKYYVVTELFTHRDIHNKIYPLEQDLHVRCNDLHYLPSINFGGATYECFNTDFINIYPDIVRDIEEDKYTREQLDK